MAFVYAELYGNQQFEETKIRRNDSTASSDCDGAAFCSDRNCMGIFKKPDLYTWYIFWRICRTQPVLLFLCICTDILHFIYEQYRGNQISHKIGTVLSNSADWDSGKYLRDPILWCVSVSAVLPGIGALLSYLFMVEHQQNQLESEHREKLSNALELEKELTRKAKAAGAVKNTFLANMSHDIRTPMNAIIGFADIIAKHPDDEIVVRNAITKIQASGDVLLKIINDVLDLSKIESGKAEVVETVTDLEQMTEKLEMMLEYSINKGKIDFRVESHIENRLVWCDATKLQQILVNVLNNAVKFTPERGTIVFSTTERMIAPGLGEYQFTVKDTGIGMTEEFQKHAFEAFERERTSTESKTEGTGLGLAIVKKLVNLMNGEVNIYSKSGQGTRIQITLPLRIAMGNQLHLSDIAHEPTINLTGMHVLLVEDNELNAEIAMEVLKNAGVLTTWMPDGYACVEEVQNQAADTYQFILMDVQMPRMNGYEATQKIRQLADGKESADPDHCHDCKCI